MSKNSRKLFFDILKYSATLGIAAFLLWYVYRDLSLEELLQDFDKINYTWLSLSVVLALLSHFIRAYRWNILLEPLGYNHLKSYRTFIAVMVGYFANNLVPRLGEVTRCGILKKTDNVAITSAFGSVVAERALDLIILLVLAGITFIVEFDKLHMFVYQKFEESFPNSDSFYTIAIGATILGIFLLAGAYLIFRIYRKRLHHNAIYLKVRQFVKELLAGFLSIRKVKSPILFWLSTAGIWLLYYFMLIVVFYAFPPTAGLTFIAGLTLLIMSGFGMSAPVQGGIGVFHILVSSVLVLYGISAEDGKVFALIAHSTQFMTVMVFGGISFIISVFMKKSQNNVDSNKNSQPI